MRVSRASSPSAWERLADQPRHSGDDTNQRGDRREDRNADRIGQPMTGEAAADQPGDDCRRRGHECTGTQHRAA